MKITFKSAIFAIIIAVIIIVIPFGLRWVANYKIISGIKIADIDLGGLTYDQATSVLEERINSLSNDEIILEFGDKNYRTTLSRLGVEFDIYKTVEEVYITSRADNVFKHLQNRINALQDPVVLKPVFNIDKIEMKKDIKFLIPDIRDAKDASIVIDDDLTMKILPHEDGLKTDFNTLEKQITVALNNLDSPQLNAPFIKIAAEYTDKGANKDAKLLAGILGKELKLIYTVNGENFYEKTIEFQADWVDIHLGKMTFNEDNLKSHLKANVAKAIDVTVVNAVVKVLPDEGSDYAIVEGVARDGLKLNLDLSAQSIIDAIREDTDEVALSVDTVKSKVENKTGEDLGELTLLATGRSNFEGSPESRAFNINKGLKEKFNNILLKPGEAFSYNAHLGPVTLAAGWENSLAIFGGKNLVPVPGGGLCQVSTTLYRALVYAGLEVTEKSNHSLYVHYYKKYGDGLDAAIYPGSKDLRFINNTDSHIFIQSYVDGDDAYVNIYGTPDGRKVELVGPIYSNKKPDSYVGDVTAKWNQIKWIQRITNLEGDVEENILTSTYRTTPK